MIISTLMSLRKKNLDRKPIEPEVLDPSEEETAEISPPPEVSHRVIPKDPHPTDITAVVRLRRSSNIWLRSVSTPISPKKKNCACSKNIEHTGTATPP